MKITARSYRGVGLGLLAGGLALVFAGAAVAAGPKSGSEWEIKTTMEMPGMPFAMPPTTVRQCLEDQAVPYQQNKDQKCDTVYKNVSGNTIDWQVTCTDKNGKMELTGVSSYTGNTMDSKIKMKSKQGDMSMHMTGKKLGVCK